jgi:hypothetical protein
VAIQYKNHAVGACDEFEKKVRDPRPDRGTSISACADTNDIGRTDEIGLIGRGGAGCAGVNPIVTQLAVTE